ncbi:uncharacterized protein Hap1MRO34_004118 [Clarias gariepinus]|uniref:uncharacterized protein LOC128519422 n=1 Tax=Clarias gariepinus TaxID=13013 RepID=UPI00234C57FB|nr:uncharacterized protein LOC128519422 [Clarias gariepinus]
MSAVEDSVASAPLCQGFLKKRKDKIRLKWVTYWFKLHNTTMTFYNKEYGCTSDLKGQYYLNAVETVREVAWPKKKHYVFEITMKNGKRKVLAAESAGLRQLWIGQLLQAINQHVFNTTELNSTCETAADPMYRSESSHCIVISNSQSEASDKLSGKLQSAEPESFLWSHNIRPAPVIPTTTSNIQTVETPHPEDDHCTMDEVEQKPEVIELENDYDVPRRCKPLHSEEGIYETPPSNRRASDRDRETTESIYDVPKYALRKERVNEASCARETPEITGLLHNIVTCLEGNSGDWVRVTAPGAICQP